ncbi:retrovirus-related Pol polyprotein from transposon 297 [Trichonephila clavipes]|nr:retrovirus-related Pol polyprotein from transposon 297 [Trichonephila clavipes]
MEINGIDRVCLRDSGSSIDVCSRSWINEDDLLGEYVWLKSPLDEICHCLPLAKIKIKTKKGEFYTKAAIKQDSSDNDLYLLGNRTAELLESDEQGCTWLTQWIDSHAKYNPTWGLSFTSELTITTFFNKFGIKVTRSSVSHPQSNAVERVHRTSKRVIKALCVESGEDWEGVLPLALFSLRTVAHESTGFSPTELVMGKNLRTPQTLVYEEWMEEGNTSQSVVEYILQLNNRLKRCQDIAITRMKECQLKRKTWYDRDVVERKFVEGDLVMVLVTSKQNKLEVNWIGPGKLVSLVVEEVSDNIEGDAEIPYPDKQCTKFDYHEILRESQLQLKLSPSQIDELKQVITKNKDVFSPGPGTTHLMRMDIELISDKPIKTKPYRMSPRQINILREEIKRLLELGVIEIGQSDYTSPLILVESPNKDPRPCVDYRRLNEITRAEFFPFAKCGRDSRKSECGSLCKGDGFVERLLSDSAHAESSEIRSFRYSIWHLYPQENDVRVNDIAIFSQGWKDHVKHIDIVLGRLRKAGLKVKPSKCKFAQEEVLFLGHRIGSGSRSPSDLKIKAIADFPRPTTKTHVRSFLGLVGYYSHYIPNNSTIASPLTDALKGKIKKEKITWDEKCGKAFEELKAKLVTQPILFAPDFATEFILQTDASEVGAGVVLSQRIEGEEHPIVFLSKKFSKGISCDNFWSKAIKALFRRAKIYCRNRSQPLKVPKQDGEY